MQINQSSLWFQATALFALQEAVEAFAVSLFKDVNICTIHLTQAIIMPRGIQLAWRIWHDMVKYLLKTIILCKKFVSHTDTEKQLHLGWQYYLISTLSADCKSLAH